MIKKIILLLVLVVVLAGCSSLTDNSVEQDTFEPVMEDVGSNEMLDDSDEPLEEDETVEVYELEPQNNSGQSGTASLSQMNNGQTRVVLSLTGGNFPLPQPAHIHIGTCENIGDVLYPLNDVVSGESETVVNVSNEDIYNTDHPGLAINVHESAANMQNYTACVTLIEE